ncbi:MAG TPA: hypothetical protein PKW26_00925, partial [Treponemataceae bacterium]|nr:hypothetical protein [Treponemataceae bacterium]
AYVTTSGDDGKLYLLSHTTTTEVIDGDKKSVAAVHDGTETVFSNTVLIASGTKGVYTMDGNKIKYGTETSSIEVSGAKSMALYNDSLLIGTTSGIVLVNLDNDGKPTSTGTMFGENIESSIAMLEIKTLYSFGDAIYAFAVDKTTSKKTNTWGYYKDRPNWNVE